MVFHDLSLAAGDATTRRELLSTALQLGYTSLATDRVHTGAISDGDRCVLKPLEVASVLAAAPGTAESVRFHQRLLGVGEGDGAFRQYSRVTVVVDDAGQAGALNSGNQVLRTYDVVAVRPTNQRAFEQVCKNAEVDLISLDMFKRLPFRMKAPMVKLALQRGLFFEISYGRALFDARARKELFANAQVLQTVTRGNGIVISSGASQGGELRGPNDVANMATLFGLSVESAKAAISKNCESVILHGVARKKAYKAAIIVERVPPVSQDFLFAVPNVWDPLSVGTAKGSSVKLGPLLDINATEDAKKKSSPVLKPDAGKEQTFISMVNLTSEWTEVGKRGKKSKEKRPKTTQLNSDSKKRKFS